MALGNCLTMSLNGVLAQLVDVEANVGHGLPGMHVVGQTDTAISESIEAVLGDDFLEEENDELCDVVLLWWRDEDGDLVDGLVDASRPLADNGAVWLLTPGAGKPGTVEPGLISESAQLAGLVQTKAERLGEWQGSCLVQRGYTKK